MENKTLKEQFLELSEKIMLSAEAGEFIDIVDVMKYDNIVIDLYESGEWEKQNQDESKRT